MNDLTDAELARVAAYLRDRGVAVAGPLTASRIAGGRSNLTLRLSDGAGGWVLRLPPRAGRTPSAHDVAREYRVTSALFGTEVPVPRPVALCEDETVLGAPFTVTGFVSGRGIQARGELDELGDGLIAQIVDRLAETLAALHRVDHLAVGLETFGRPDGYAGRQVRRWSRQWDLVATDDLRAHGEKVAARLAAAVPGQRSTSIVHGDFRLDNTLLDLTGRTPRIAAVVDWELSTIGDPVADVAMMCAYRDPLLDLIVGAPGAWTSDRLPGVHDLTAAYEKAGGAPLDAWEFHLALAYFKIGVIAAGIAHRRRAGAATGQGFDTAGDAVEGYLELADRTLGTAR